MQTVGCSGRVLGRGVCPEGVCSEGVCSGWLVSGHEGLSDQRVSGQGVSARHPPWTEWQAGVKRLPCHNYIADSKYLFNLSVRWWYAPELESYQCLYVSVQKKQLQKETTSPACWQPRSQHVWHQRWIWGIHLRDPPCLWNLRQTIPEVQTRVSVAPQN